MDLLLILLLMTQYGHWAFCYVACGLLCPISFWASLTLSNHVFSWAFTNSFRLPCLNYFILHPWGLWTCHQPFTFFNSITLDLLWLILTFLHHILLISLPILSLRAPLSPFASSRLICSFHGLAIPYSCRLGLMVFLSTY